MLCLVKYISPLFCSRNLPTANIRDLPPQNTVHIDGGPGASPGTQKGKCWKRVAVTYRSARYYSTNRLSASAWYLGRNRPCLKF
jgi:hypothetical protein